MADVKHSDGLPSNVDVVNHTVTTYSDTPAFATYQLKATRRSGVFGKPTYGFEDSLISLIG
jgi:hypothetical protein